MGIGTEAALAVLKFGFEKIGFAAIYGAVDPENIVSEKILIKIGMKYIKMVKWTDEKFHKMYCMSKKEYNELRIMK